MIKEFVLVATWVVKYNDGKMVGHGGKEASVASEAKHFFSEEAAAATAITLNKGLQIDHLGYVVVERIS